jgi:syntaxin-binding protein 1
MTSKTKGMMSSFFKSRGKKAEQHAATAEGEYTDSRFVGALKGLLEQLLNSDLPIDKYPALGPTIGSSNEAKSAAKSVRRFGANSRWGKKESNVTGGRYMCFVAGGMTHSETRSAYELQSQHSKEVICGATHFITGSEYMAEVSKLS